MVEIELSLVLSATGGRVIGGIPPEKFTGVSTDSRQIGRGELFVALKGEKFDGHDFIASAIKGGAGAALISSIVEEIGPLIVVDDTLIGLGALAATHRARYAPRTVAVTGSTGKTTTKEMIAAILSQGWKTNWTRGNYNNEIGVPLTLLELEGCHEALVVELAMRGRGQIGYLARMVKPTVGVITNIGVSHLELLGSIAAIAEAKAELLDNLPEEGVSVLNAEDRFYDMLKARARGRVITFGQEERADVSTRELSLRPDEGVEFTLKGPWGTERVMLATLGRHQAANAAAAAAAAYGIGAPVEWIIPGLKSFKPSERRSQVYHTEHGLTVIDDSYNAAPDSMRAALELLADLPGGSKWAILGDMKELGPTTDEWHSQVGKMAAQLGVMGVIGVGKLGGLIAEGAREGSSVTTFTTKDNEEAIELIDQLARPGDVVLVKGSRVMKMEAIVEKLRRRGRERESVE